MEFLIYLSTYMLTLCFIFFPKLITGKIFFIFWYSFSLCLSIIIRSSIGIQDSADIDGYIVSMQGEDIIPYFLREPIFWFGTRFLYDILGNGIYVFIFLDALLFLLIYYGFDLCRKAFHPKLNSSNLHYLYFAVFLFFPYVVGMHNIYRQIFATTIFIVSIGLIGNNKIFKGYISSLVAVLIHNPAAFFLPLLIMSMKKSFYKYLAFIVLALILFSFQTIQQTGSSLLYAYFLRDDSIIIGDNIAYLYLISLYIILGIVLLIEFQIEDKSNTHFVSMFIILTILYSYVAFLFGSEQSQRFVFYIFGILFPFFGFYFESRFKPIILSRLIFFHVSLMPLILIYNTTIDVSL